MTNRFFLKLSGSSFDKIKISDKDTFIAPKILNLN